MHRADPKLGESKMTKLDAHILGVTFGLLVAFGIRTLASWLAMRDRNKQLSHYIETLPRLMTSNGSPSQFQRRVTILPKVKNVRAPQNAD
jgi:hypothetical protein